MRRNHTWMLCIGLSIIGLLIMPFLLAGCKKGAFETAKVRGTVYCNGKPVEGGLIIFYPQAADGVSRKPGKGASSTINADGTFELGTYDTEDGAVIGRCRVKVYEPDLTQAELLVEGDEDVEEEPLELACDMSESDNYIVEVKSGANDIRIELSMKE